MNYCIFKPNFNECAVNGRVFPTYLVVDVGTLSEYLEERGVVEPSMRELFALSETEEDSISQALKWIKEWG